MIGPGAQAKAQVLVTIVLRKYSARIRHKSERIGLFLLVRFWPLSGHIDQNPFERSLWLPYLSQRQQRRFTALDAALGDIDKPYLFTVQVGAKSVIAVFRIVDDEAAGFQQPGAKYSVADEDGDAQLSAPKN